MFFKTATTLKTTRKPIAAAVFFFPFKRKSSNNNNIHFSTFKSLNGTEIDREPIVLGKVSPRLPVPPTILAPPYATSSSFLAAKKHASNRKKAEIKSPAEIQTMRKACALASSVLAHIGTLVAPGVTTDALDRAAHTMIIDRGAYPSPLLYRKFPKSICTSVNEVMCHGIPDDRPLRDGDIVNLDVTVYLDGFHGDCSATFPVGSSVSSKATKLIRMTRQAMLEGIKVCGPGVPFYTIGTAISNYVNRQGHGHFSIPEEFVGHGIGSFFHGPPYIYHTQNNYGEALVGATRMQPGHTFTIEPIVVASPTCDYLLSKKDGWTIFALDGAISAQFEHTVLITENGVEILTAQPGDSSPSSSSS